MRRLYPLLMSVSLALACSLDQTLAATSDRVSATLEQAMGKLEKQSSDWQATLTHLQSDLVAQGQSTLANEVQNLMSRGIATGGVELRCDADIIGNGMKQGLERIIARLKNQPPPPIIPAFCQIVPTKIDLSLGPDRQKVVEFYGYNLDANEDAGDPTAGTAPASVHLAVPQAAPLRLPPVVVLDTSSKVTVWVQQTNGNLLPVASSLYAMPTHYLMTINVSSTNGIAFGPDSQKLVIRFGKTILSTVTVIQPPPPTACGAAGEPCCSATTGCNAGLDCTAGTCVAPPCGGSGEPVCQGNPCTGGLSPIEGRCVQLTWVDHTTEQCGESVMRWVGTAGRVNIYKGQTASFYVVKGGSIPWDCGTGTTGDGSHNLNPNTNYVTVVRDPTSRNADVTCYQVSP